MYFKFVFNILFIIKFFRICWKFEINEIVILIFIYIYIFYLIKFRKLL